MLQESWSISSHHPWWNTAFRSCFSGWQLNLFSCNLEPLFQMEQRYLFTSRNIIKLSRGFFVLSFWRRRRPWEQIYKINAPPTPPHKGWNYSPSPSCSPGFRYRCILRTCSEILRSLSGSIYFWWEIKCSLLGKKWEHSNVKYGSFSSDMWLSGSNCAGRIYTLGLFCMHLALLGLYWWDFGWLFSQYDHHAW